MVLLCQNNIFKAAAQQFAGRATLLLAVGLLFVLGGCAPVEHYWYKKLPEPKKHNVAVVIPHIVKEGEKIWDIAERYDVDALDILEYNKITVEDAPNIEPGTRLMIPRATKDTVAEKIVLDKNPGRQLKKPEDPHRIESEPYFVCPVPGPIVQGFNDLSENGTNLGVDIAAPAGADVVAVKSGVVTACQENAKWGKIVVIDHGKAEHTFYAHLGYIAVHKGQVVKQRQKIGTIAAGENPVLHFRIYREGKPIDPYGRFPRY